MRSCSIGIKQGFLDPIIKDKFILKKFEDKNFVEKFDELSLSEKQEIIDYEFYVKYLDNKIWYH